MIVENLKQVLKEYKGNNAPFVRSLLKESLQGFVLNFVYTHPVYKNLIFTGGTCLKKVYGLPRLSEDLDFNYAEKLNFSILKFSQDITEYFNGVLSYKDMTTKVSGNQNSVFLKFPVLNALGFAKTSADSPVLFLRCDFYCEKSEVTGTQVDSLSTKDFVFFVRSYDLPTLFANKIVAFLERDYKKGREQVTPFKGRDVFDLMWFFSRSFRDNLSPNWEQVFFKLSAKSKKDIMNEMLDKMKKIKSKDLYTDLRPFIESEETLSNFSANFISIAQRYVKEVKEW